MSIGIIGQANNNPAAFGDVVGLPKHAENAPEAVSAISGSDASTKSNISEIKPSTISQAAAPLMATIEKAAQDLQSYMKSSGRNLSFSIDQSTGYQVVRVMNADTGELVRQMPSPEFLKLAESLPQLNSGFINQKA